MPVSPRGRVPGAMATAHGNWERLVNATLRREQLGGGCPPLLTRSTNYDEILQAADEIQAEDPNVARISTQREMAERLNQELWRERWQTLENLTRAHASQRQPVVDPPLYAAAKKDDVDRFIRALVDHCAKGVSLRAVLELRSPSKNTLLHAAAESDNNVKAVINFVPDDLISCKNSRGETPLHIAARAGKTGVVELLLDRVNPTCTDHSGNSPLHEAVRNHSYEVIRRLLSADPNPLYRQNKDSKSPWCLAVETGDLDVLRILLEVPNDGEDQRRSESGSVFGMSPVHVAVMYEKMEMLTMMWEKKPWLFQLKDAGGGTPRHYAVYRNYFPGVKFLIEKFPASALEPDIKDGYLPIHVACMMNRVGVIEELLRQWPDPAEFLTGLGQNILHVSARYGRIATVKSVLRDPKFCHLINARDFDGNTPLHLAALHCQPSVVLLARHRRVHPELVNMNNMTARDVVKQDIKAIGAPLRKRFTRIILVSARTPRSRELAICKPTGQRPRKRREPQERDTSKDQANTRMVVAGLMATVTFTSGFSVPGGYNSSNPDAGMPTLLHKAMYNVFVVSNSVAMYSSIVAIVILLWTQVNDPYLIGVAVDLSNIPLLVTLAAMPLAFMAGVYVTVTKLAGLSIFVLVFGSLALLTILIIFILMYVPFGHRYPLVRWFTDRLIFVILVIARRETEGSEPEGTGTAGRVTTSVEGRTATSVEGSGIAGRATTTVQGRAATSVEGSGTAGRAATSVTSVEVRGTYVYNN